MAVKIDLAKRTVALSVGDLVAEPLTGIGRVAGLSVWTRMALGRETHAQHQAGQAERHAGYAREIAVRYATRVDDFAVTIQGRIDGVYPPANEKGVWVIEEIKSVVLPPLMFGALDAGQYPQYIEQLRLYCFFVEQNGAAGAAPATRGRLVFINVADGARREIELPGPFDDCAGLIATRVGALIRQATNKQEQHRQRWAVARELAFPFPRPRKHQDEMLAAVEQVLEKGRHLLVSAPSGLGKTAGALYPAVKYALAHDGRVFFVTAKNTQHQQALETVRKMGPGVTAVSFRAREKMCINSVYACREEFCPHLQMFAAKLERTGVLPRLEERGVVSADDLVEAGRGTSLCPFELALLGAERADVIVCDYNYVFDPQVYLRRFFQDADYADAILIVDEAHNLVQRAMEYYSPLLRRRQVGVVLKNLRHVEPALAKEFRYMLGRLDEYLESLRQERGDEYSQLPDEEVLVGDKFLIEPPRSLFTELRPQVNRLAVRYFLDKLMSGRAVPDDPVEEFFADFAQFANVLALEGEEFSHLYDSAESGSVKIVCKDASRQLAERLDGFHSVVAMSATLAPTEFYQRMLGFEAERTEAVAVPSPFPRERRKILVVPDVLTTYRQRRASYGRIAEIVETTVAARRGNYMALFPSYDFLRRVAELLPAKEWQLRVQDAGMSEAQRQELLDSLREIEPPKLVLAVQGGVFAEGVDYPGALLQGVVVVSPALPQVSFERELMRRYYEDKSGRGFEFAYLYPGMNRVIQSVGRLIRSETDCGVAVLVCQRFTQKQYSTLFPADWSEGDGSGLVCRDLGGELRRFWREMDEIGLGKSALQRGFPEYNAGNAEVREDGIYLL